MNSRPVPETWVTVPESKVMYWEFWKETAALMSGSNSVKGTQPLDMRKLKEQRP